MNRNVLISYISGALFALSWWLLIDANAISNYYKLEDGKVTFVHYLPGLACSFAYIILNSIKIDSMQLSDINDLNWRSKLGLFIGFMLLFSGLFGAAYLMIGVYIASTPTPPAGNPSLTKFALLWPGIAVFLQSLLLVVSTFLMRFARKIDYFK